MPKPAIPSTPIGSVLAFAGEINEPDIPPGQACPELRYIIHFANPDLLLDCVV